MLIKLSTACEGSRGQSHLVALARAKLLKLTQSKLATKA